MSILENGGSRKFCEATANLDDSRPGAESKLIDSLSNLLRRVPLLAPTVTPPMGAASIKILELPSSLTIIIVYPSERLLAFFPLNVILIFIFGF
jgi:hypothetical protein